MKFSKKKLLITTDSFLPRWDGISRFLVELIPHLKKKFEITIVAPAFEGDIVEIEGADIVRIPVTRYHAGDYHIPKFKFGKMKRLVKENDIIFNQTIGPIGALGIIYGKKLKKKVVSYIHSIEWELIPSSIQKLRHTLKIITKNYVKYLYNKCSLLLLPSEDTLKLFNYAGIKTEKRIVHLGTETAIFKPPQDKDAAKKRVGIDADNVVIGYVGRVGREKDLPTLYKAFRTIKKTYPKTILLIVGSGLDLHTLFDSMEDVVQIPQTKEVPKYLQAMDIFVMPSLTETSSLATMEAMACGLAVVSTYVGHIKFYIMDGQNGYLFPRSDVAYLVKKLKKLMDNADLRKAIGVMARKTITTYYYWGRTVKEIEKELLEAK